MKTYYKEQLAKINVGHTAFASTIKVFANGNGEDTKHIPINKESAEILVKWLKSNFIDKNK